MSTNYSSYENLTSLFTDLGNRLRSKPTAVEVTQAQYNALTPAEKADTSKIYMITDQGGGGGGCGLLPYFYIDSEPDSTVTVTAPDGSTIIPTAEGSGHWECEVPMYGTYIIHSVLAGQGDATISVAVDNVREYHITDNHFDFTINITAPNGSTIRITSGTEIYTGTGTGSSQAFAVHQVSATYTVAVTIDGNTKTETVTSAATTGQSTNINIEFGTIIVTVDPDFITAGSTITCTKDNKSCTPKAAASTITFNVPEIGTWIVSSEIGGQPFVKNAIVSNLSTLVETTLQVIPNGKTVLPTDDIQTWLNCAMIDKSYTTLAEVLADEETLYALLTSDNANNYLVRSKTWIGTNGITDSELAMQIIGADDYASETLLADSDWCEGICTSEYFESVLNAKVPTLTADSANVIGVTTSSSYPAWKAFDGDDTSYATQTDSGGTNYVGYDFGKQVTIDKFVSLSKDITAFKIQCTDDLSGSWTDVDTITGLSGTVTTDKTITPTTARYWRLKPTGTSGTGSLYTLQFYGREAGGVQTWLKAAGIQKPYTTVAEVLADHVTLQKLISNHDAVDYLVTAKGFIDDICSDATAMRYIGLRNYAADTLLSDSEWCEGICNSAYFEGVLNVKVPTMTSNTTPSEYGSINVVTSVSTSSTYYTNMYKAFDDDDTTVGTPWNNPDTNNALGFVFDTPRDIYKIKLLASTAINASQINANTLLQYTTDGDNWITYEHYDPKVSSSASETVKNVSIKNVLGIRLASDGINWMTSSGSFKIYTLQFYGRKDVDETKIQVLSAANDNVKIDGVPLCTTGSDGSYEITRGTDIANGTYVFSSNVAKDPDDLTADYSRQLTVDNDTIAIEVMPDGTLYWYGYIGSELENLSSANGWDEMDNYSSFTDPTYNLNNIFIPTQGNSYVSSGIGGKNKITPTKINCIAHAGPSTYNEPRVMGYYTSKVANDRSANTIAISDNSDTLYSLVPSVSDGIYPYIYKRQSSSIYVSAFWFE